ncbi:hypothetical protein SYJ56_15200 [Algoriphagus sp. D3-2-R+10]|uniref:hypothetical protein n=1 Tax=Algoriphagus aurantiacus TaxID=3103948 RepID=UPI002B38AA6E|nr:hypothetical protein [Algoriphagus sp. D3-2-R+10]MEB2776670.1 hypothetical protein [Algoriphagus sp. D3-2-R+10]
MRKVDFVEIGSLASYLGKNGRILIREFDINLCLDYLPVRLIKSNGEIENLRCSAKLTDLIQKVRSVVQYLPYFIVIETSLKRKSISINRVNDDQCDLKNYAVEIETIQETSEIIRNALKIQTDSAHERD